MFTTQKHRLPTAPKKSDVSKFDSSAALLFNKRCALIVYPIEVGCETN